MNQELVIVKMQKQKVGGGGEGDQGGCERSIEVMVKMQTKSCWGRVRDGEVSVDVNEELK